MKLIKAISMLIIITVFIDFFQSYYYLEKYGYANELNPLITSRESLGFYCWLKLIVIISCTWLLIVIFDYYPELTKLKLMSEYVFMFSLGFNVCIIFRNFLVIL